MTEARNEYGVIGLGRMGGNLALQALERGIRVVGHTLEGVPPEMVEAGLEEAASLQELKDKLSAPRAVFLYVPAGPVVDKLLDDLAAILDEGDVVVDGGNSYWGDSIRRHRRLKEQGIGLVDLGTSGGFDGARHGACFMAGGSRGRSHGSSRSWRSSRWRAGTSTPVPRVRATSPSSSTTA